VQAYLPFLQLPFASMIVVVKTTLEPEALISAARQQVLALDAEQPIYEIRTLAAMRDRNIAPQRLNFTLLSLFALVALTLASVGLYGVISHAVTERTHEIGVRMALGAEARHVLGLMVRQGLTTTIAGVAIGVAGAVALSRWIESLLFGVTATDPTTFAAVVATLMAVALVACYIPAWRATRVDPSTALRSE